MKYLLDTNIISEIQKSSCNQNVRAFINKIPSEDLYISAISIGELCFGIEKLSDGKKKHDLSIWVHTKIPEWFNGRIIPLDTDVLLEWGKLRAKTKRTIPVIDSLIASAAITHHMTLVTRNTKDFDDIEGMMLMNPWEF
ncbi:MAG: type II toxin-antitoxin system VapC family toxin [Treponema sp.]|jgi:predicted nucleic acid-binding protein|nr:type II toxin-antitoxin system VapC family toxin [Treponema sp.]